MTDLERLQDAEKAVNRLVDAVTELTHLIVEVARITARLAGEANRLDLLDDMSTALDDSHARMDTWV